MSEDGYKIESVEGDRGPQLFSDVFASESGYMVLAYLQRVCCAGPADSPFNPDALAMARMVGRMEVFKEIQFYARIPQELIDRGARRLAELRGNTDE